MMSSPPHNRKLCHLFFHRLYISLPSVISVIRIEGAGADRFERYVIFGPWLLSIRYGIYPRRPFEPEEIKFPSRNLNPDSQVECREAIRKNCAWLGFKVAKNIEKWHAHLAVRSPESFLPILSQTRPVSSLSQWISSA
jgi:hypothetical protein